ncbi:MAG: hypothetical protein IPK16_05385 [Anaerolineales bacterium]|nr:hypothetical protein [Anaerolineales bacterium]
MRTFQSGNTRYAEYAITGFELSGETGAPGLPVFATMLQAPPGVAPRIQVLHDDTELLAAPAPVAPIAQPVIDFEPIAPLPKTHGSEFVMDAAVYAGDALAPHDVVTVGALFVGRTTWPCCASFRFNTTQPPNRCVSIGG